MEVNIDKLTKDVNSVRSRLLLIQELDIILTGEHKEVVFSPEKSDRCMSESVVFSQGTDHHLIKEILTVIQEHRTDMMQGLEGIEINQGSKGKGLIK